jgi:hypothetical protein
MLLSLSIVNVAIAILLLAAVCGDDIHRFHEKAKSSQDAVGGFSLFFLVNKRSVEFSVETIPPASAVFGRLPFVKHAVVRTRPSSAPPRSQGIHKGAAAPLVGGAGGIDACQALFVGAQRAPGVGGTYPAPACP